MSPHRFTFGTPALEAASEQGTVRVLIDIVERKGDYPLNRRSHASGLLSPLLWPGFDRSWTGGSRRLGPATKGDSVTGFV